MNKQTSDGLTCNFCGAPDATPMCLPDLSYPAFPENKLSPWGHPRTGNACRECAVKQMALASAGRLVPAVTPEAVAATRLWQVAELCKLHQLDARCADVPEATWEAVHQLGWLDDDGETTEEFATIHAALQQAREPGAVRALPEKWRSEAAEREAKATKSDSFGGEAGHLMAKIFYECAAELEAAIASVEPGEPTVSEFTQEQRDELRRLAEKLKAHHSDRDYCNGECREYAVAVGAISLLDSIRTTEQGRTIHAALQQARGPGEPTDGELLDALEPLLSFWGQGSSSEVYGFELEEIEDFRITVDEVEKVSEDVAERMVAGDFVTLRDLARAIIAQRGGKE